MCTTKLLCHQLHTIYLTFKAMVCHLTKLIYFLLATFKSMEIVQGISLPFFNTVKHRYLNSNEINSTTHQRKYFCARILRPFSVFSKNSVLSNSSGTVLSFSSEPYTNQKQRIVVVGGGFGGLYTALQVSKQFRDDEAEVVLIDPKDRFVFLPLLYELAVGTASAVEVAPSYSSLLNNSKVIF